MEIVNHLIGQESNTLSHLRNLIGSVQKYETSGRIQESNYANASPRGVYYYTTLALSLLHFTFQEASFAFVATGFIKASTFKNNPGRYKERFKQSRMALAFISGTGLEVMLESYGLDYDAEKLRTLFYEKFHVIT